MIAEQAIVSLLRADAAVAAVVGTRIRPHSDGQDLVSPYITYQRIDTAPIARTYKAPAPFRRAVIQVDCYSNERGSGSAPMDVFDLARKVRQALDDKGGVFGGGEVSAILYDGQQTLPEQDWQRVSMDFAVWEKEQIMAEGLIFRDSADARVTLEYSVEVPPVVAATWVEVTEVRSITQNPEAAPRIPLTHFKSPKQEFRLGLSGDGTYDVVCNLVPTELAAGTDESQITIFGFAASGARRWWRITLPKAVSTSTTAFSRVFDGGVEVASLGLGGTEDAFSFNFTILSFGSETDTPEARGRLMPVLTKEALAATWRRKERVVDVPELGAEAQVIVAEMSGLDATDYYAVYREFDALPEDERTQRRQLDMMALVIERSCLDDSHEPLFERGGFLQVCNGLGATETWSLAQRIFGEAMDLNGFISDESAEGNESSEPSGVSRAA